MRVSTGLAALLGVGFLIAAAPLSAQLEGACFDLEGVGAWRAVDGASGPLPTESADSMFLTPPTRIRLSAEARGRARQVEVPEGALDIPLPLRLWRVEGDSLHLLFTRVIGHPGVGGAFVRDAGDWRGELRTVRGEPAVSHERGFVLHPVGCDTPPPFPASVDRPVLRSVELASGAVLELGSPLPVGVRVERRPTGAWTVLEQAGGRFAGADTVIVVPSGPDDAPIGWIELRSIEPLDLEPLLLGLIREFGAPERRSGGGVEWVNRTTLMYMSNPRRVILIDPRIRP